MKRLTFKEKKEALENSLVSLGLDKKYSIEPSDARLGQRFAIAVKTENSVNIKTEFMTYDEMNCFINGYQRALNNPLN